MNLYSTLKTKLEAWTGLQVHPLRKPDGASMPCIIYRGVGTRNHVAHSGDTGLRAERVMIIILANDFPTLRTYVNSLENNLIGNSTDFDAAIPGTTKVEDVDDDGINFYMRDFYITYNK
jgi:hypothetical protein